MFPIFLLLVLCVVAPFSDKPKSYCWLYVCMYVYIYIHINTYIHTVHTPLYHHHCWLHTPLTLLVNSSWILFWPVKVHYDFTFSGEMLFLVGWTPMFVCEISPVCSHCWLRSLAFLLVESPFFLGEFSEFPQKKSQPPATSQLAAERPPQSDPVWQRMMIWRIYIICG